MSIQISDPMLPELYKVTKIQENTHDTFTLEMVPKNKTKIFSFLPGQFNMIYLFGVGEVPISISGDPSSTDFLVHTIRAVGTVTDAMSKIKEGQTVGIRGPFGSHWPIEKAMGKDVLLIAGGIGLAPLRPVVYYILAHRSKYRKVVLLYGTRSPDDIIYEEEYQNWQENFDITVETTVDNTDSEWQGHVGIVSALISKKDFSPTNMVAIICGPEIMMHFSVQELVRREVTWNDIYISMERNMKCAIGFCGHCQYGAKFICKDGPVFCYSSIQETLKRREI